MEKEKGQNDNHESRSTEQYELINYHYFKKYQELQQLTLTLQLNFQEIKERQKRSTQAIDKLATRAQGIADTERTGSPSRKKKLRRVADQIHKDYICQVWPCQNQYASETSLRKHIKLQHPQRFISKKKGRKCLQNCFP